MNPNNENNKAATTATTMIQGAAGIAFWTVIPIKIWEVLGGIYKMLWKMMMTMTIRGMGRRMVERKHEGKYACMHANEEKEDSHSLLSDAMLL